MRIIIDMQGMQTQSSKLRGVGRYTKEMVKALLEVNNGQDEILLALNGAFKTECFEIMRQFCSLVPREHFKIWTPLIETPSYFAGDFSIQRVHEYSREFFLNQYQPDFIWSTNLQEGWLDKNVSTSVKKYPSGCQYVSTLHDLTPLLFKETLLNEKIEPWYRQKLAFAVESDIILTVSEFSKEKINELLTVPLNRIVVAPNAADLDIFKPDNTRLDINKKDKYILFVGGPDPHKNLRLLLKAYSMVAFHEYYEYKLILVGKGLKDILENEQLNDLYKLDKIVLYDSVTDQDLIRLMQNCYLLVFPAYAEGFGLPALEAMACGAPVIAANTTSLPQVVGRPDALFNPHDLNELVALLKRVKNDIVFAQSLIQDGITQSKKFSWKKSAHIILDSFHTFYRKSTRDKSNVNYKDVNKLICLIKEVPGYQDINIDSLSQEICDNLLKNSSPTIYIDLSTLVYTDAATGIQRVVRAITKNLMQIKNLINYEVTPVFSHVNTDFYFKTELKNDKFLRPAENEMEDRIVDFNEGDILLVLDLHPANVISKEEYYQKLQLRGTRIYFVQYDLLPLKYPEYFSIGLPEEFERLMYVESKSDGIIGISHDVVSEFLAWIKDKGITLPPYFKYASFYLGCDIKNTLPSSGLPKDTQLTIKKLKDKINILMVSTIEPRKRHPQVLKAMELLWEQGYDVNLIIVGKMGWNMESFLPILEHHSERDSHLFWLNGISDEYLDKIYKLASCILMASVGEGFGLSIVEGARYGKPLILRDIPVFREIAGKNAFYFTGLGPEDLAKAIKNWIDLYKRKVAPPSKNIKIITWEQSTEEFLSALSIVSRRKIGKNE